MDLLPLAVALAGGGGLMGTLVSTWWQHRTRMAELLEERRTHEATRFDSRTEDLLDRLTAEVERYKKRTITLENEVMRLTRELAQLRAVTSGPVWPTG